MNSEQPFARDKIAQVYIGSWGDEETQAKTRARIDWLVDQVKNSTVLDIGCSEGILPILLGRKGIEVTGIDINPEAIEFAKTLLNSEAPETVRHITFSCADILTSDWGNNQYEYVIIGEIIEHFANPDILINKAISLIKPGGIILVTTPFGYFPDSDHRFTFTLTNFQKFFRAEDISPLTLVVVDGYIRFSAKKISDLTNRWAVIDKSILEINEQGLINEQKVFHNRINRLRDQQRDLKSNNQLLLSQNKELERKYQGLVSQYQRLKELNQQLEKTNRDLITQNLLLENNISDINKKINQSYNALRQAKLENAQLDADHRSLRIKYKGMTARYELITHSTPYQMSVEIKNAFNPIGVKTLKLPITVTKLFIQWAKKKNTTQRIIEKIKTVTGLKAINQSKVFDEQAQENTFLISLDLFIKKAEEHPAKLVIIINSTTKRMGGLKRINRPMAFARELAKMDIPVMYVYYRWNAGDDIDSDYDGSYLLQLPNSLFHKLAPRISISFQNTKKLLLISIPDISAVTELTMFKLHGWEVGYEVRDDWSEFSKAGVGNWYNPTYEYFLCNNADFVTTVSNRLYDKMIDFGASKESTHIIPNGLNEEFLENSRTIFNQRKNGYKGKGIIGYFGHLTEKWFNWELLVKTANSHPELQFEIIGFDAPAGLNLPSNIKLLGEKTHPEIIEITKDWSLAIIPFKNNELSRAVDPIKLYEYHALGLPCVSCLMDQIVGYPFTFIYENDLDFEKTMDTGLRYTPTQAEWEILKNFVKENTWNNRVNHTLSISKIDYI